MLRRARRLPPDEALVMREEARALTTESGEPLPPIVDFDALFIPESHEKVVLIAPQLAFHEAVGARLLGASGWYHPDLVKIGRHHVAGCALHVALLRRQPAAVREGFHRPLRRDVRGGARRALRPGLRRREPGARPARARARRARGSARRRSHHPGLPRRLRRAQHERRRQCAASARSCSASSAATSRRSTDRGAAAGASRSRRSASPSLRPPQVAIWPSRRIGR